jgi:hypothetical protein
LPPPWPAAILADRRSAPSHSLNLSRENAIGRAIAPGGRKDRRAADASDSE